MHTVLKLYDRIIHKELMLKRVSLTFNDVETAASPKASCQQISMFAEDFVENKNEEQERKIQQALLGIKQKYGNNAIFKGMNFGYVKKSL